MSEITSRSLTEVTLCTPSGLVNYQNTSPVVRGSRTSFAKSERVTLVINLENKRITRSNSLGKRTSYKRTRRLDSNPQPGRLYRRMRPSVPFRVWRQVGYKTTYDRIRRLTVTCRRYNVIALQTENAYQVSLCS